MSHNNLVNYYTITFSMTQLHGWSITEMENMIPFERDLYVDLLSKHITEENNKLEARNKS